MFADLGERKIAEEIIGTAIRRSFVGDDFLDRMEKSSRQKCGRNSTVRILSRFSRVFVK